MLDIITTGLTDESQIKKNLRTFGIDLNQKSDITNALRILKEAVNYYDTEIACPREGIDPIHPELKKLSTVEGIYTIFQTAAGKKRKILIPQACALLRIGAVIDFIDSDPVTQLIPHAEEAIERFKTKYFKQKSRDNNGRSQGWEFTTGPGQIIPLDNFETRTKQRKRIIAKALHKPSNRADEVIDHIGFRITTTSASDTLRLIYNIFFNPDTAIFPGMSIRINASKNLIINAGKIVEALSNPRKANDLVKSLSRDTINHEELLVSNENETTDKHNQHSSKKYRAIHITFDLPIILPDGTRSSFPVELQVLDKKNAITRDTDPESNHNSYIERQQRAIRTRIFRRNNLLAAFEERQAQSRKQKR